MTEKAEGNALLAEEIMSFFVRAPHSPYPCGKVEFDAGAVASACLERGKVLTARVDHLDPKDRELLQAAAVIGRQFDPQLLAAVAARAAASMLGLSQCRRSISFFLSRKSGDSAFKHALVRDALYQSLLTGAARALHLKIAEEIERRSGNSFTK